MSTFVNVPVRATLRAAFVALLAGLPTIAVGSAARAQQTTRIAVTPDSKLWIEGTSNLHGWSCKAETFEATLDVDAAAAVEIAAAAPKAIKRVEVRVPVKALKCGHGGMDNNLYKALNADRTPEVTYILATLEAGPGAARDSFTLQTQGTLTIAGKQNMLAMDVSATRLADGAVRATGVVPIKMTDYGIQPPTALFGRLKTGDEVKVKFELTVGAKAIANSVDRR